MDRDNLFASFLLSLVIIVLGWIVFSTFLPENKEKIPCENFNDYAYKDLPARCVSYFERR